MSNKKKTISEKLFEATNNLDEVKKNLTDRAEILGQKAELGRSEAKFWYEIEQGGYSVPHVVTTSGNYLADSFLKTTEQLNQPSWYQQFDAVSSTASASSVSMYGTISSLVSLSIPEQHIPQSYYQTKKIIDQQESQEDLAKELEAIKPTLAVQYRNAWKALRTQETDPTRSPMFLMREVLRGMYEVCAPDEDVIAHANLTDVKEIKRSHRVNYLAMKIQRHQLDALEIQEIAFKKMYDYMSAAHKAGTLSYEKTSGNLYQANSIIRLLVNFYNQINQNQAP